jgi:hypothetical protein
MDFLVNYEWAGSFWFFIKKKMLFSIDLLGYTPGIGFHEYT